MALANQLQIDVNKPCTCTRKQFPPHCRACGSTNLTSVKSNGGWVDLPSPTGKLEHILIKGFACRRCGTGFNELTACNAPVPKPTKAQLEQAELERKRAELDTKVQAAGGMKNYLKQLFSEQEK